MTTAVPHPMPSRPPGDWPGLLDALVAEWSTTAALVELEEHRAIAELVGRWEQALETIRVEQTALRSAGRWVGGPSDMLSVIGYSRAETVHSALTGWLLDPSRRHGLGSRFLERVLARCFPHESFRGLGTARVSTEVPGPTGRIDILVTARDMTVVIENKVDAIERPGQCDDYYRDFRQETGARFVFLSPEGRPASTATGDAAAAFVSLG